MNTRLKLKRKSAIATRVKKFCLHCRLEIKNKRSDAYFCSKKCLYAHKWIINTDRMKEYFKKWREENIEYMSQYQIQYRAENPEKFKEYSRRRRAKKQEVNEIFTIEDEAFIFSLFCGRCFNCDGYENLCIDHVRPLSKGNPLTIKNACLLCVHCNSSKSNKDPEEFYTPEKFALLMSILNLIEEPPAIPTEPAVEEPIQLVPEQLVTQQPQLQPQETI